MTSRETAIKAIEAWRANPMTTFTPANILREFGDDILAGLRDHAPETPTSDLALADLDWPAGATFSFMDEPGEHDPCYIVMPGGAALAVNHHATPGVDIARAKFIVNACNAAFTAEKDDDETYEIGKRDGYSDAVQQIDVLTGGDGEYRYCTDGDPDRHTPDPATMIQRIVDRFNEGQRSTARSDGPAQSPLGPVNEFVERLRTRARFARDEGTMTAKVDATFFDRSADEIERLTATPTQSNAMTAEQPPTIMRRLTAEEERLLKSALLNSSTLAYEISPSPAPAAVEELKGSLKLVIRHTFNVGLVSGMKEHTSSKGGDTWIECWPDFERRLDAALSAPRNQR